MYFSNSKKCVNILNTVSKEKAIFLNNLFLYKSEGV